MATETPSQIVYDLREDFPDIRKDESPGEVIGTYEKERHQAADRITALEAALRYYASDEAWTVQQTEGADGDYGKRARAALKQD